MSITNSKTRLRSDLIAHNGQQVLAIESQGEDQVGFCPPTFQTKIVCILIVAYAYHSILTFPMSHYEYNKWQDKIEIGLHCPQRSPGAGD
eukprot:scaffold73043_cov40-Cyclotella_meneghiniana.AAC.1